MGSRQGERLTPSARALPSGRSLAALLSQVLVAFTLEFDNEFERRMGQADYPGAGLSLVVWANLMRFVGEAGISVRDLASRALAVESQVKNQLGCLERWRFVVLVPDLGGSSSAPSGSRRTGWGSGRGIRAGWMVRLTPKGLAASRIWPPLFGEIEQRWQKRYGKDEIARLRQALQSIADQFDIDLPHALPPGWEATAEFPPRTEGAALSVSLPALLSRLLLVFRLEFDRESPARLPLCANTLRVLRDEPIPAAEIPRLTGGSRETSDIGWQIKPYVVVVSDPAARRGKLVRLSARGMIAQQQYHRLTVDIEKRWQKRFGKDRIAALRESLQGLFARNGSDGSPLLSEGLVPAKGTMRAGGHAPALGRLAVGPAARQRMRDLVAQTEAFIRDPAATLPHYPMWDINRGFGP